MSDNSIFRRQVLEDKKEDLFGEVCIIPPTQIRVLTYLTLFIISVLAFFLFIGDYPRKNKVKGVLYSSGGVQKIFAPFKGTLKSIHVSEGDLVKKGQILGTVMVDHSLPKGENIDDTLIEELEKQIVTIKIKKQLITENATLEQEIIRNKAVRIKNKINENKALILILEKRIEVAEEIVVDYENLLRGNLISKDKHISAQDSLLEKKSQYHQIKIEINSLSQELEEDQSNNAKILIDMNQKLYDLEEKRSTIFQKIMEINGQKTFSVKARSDGYITFIQSSVDETVYTDKPLIIILPCSAELKAKLFIPTSEAGFLKNGQEIEIKYDAFPHEKYGVFKGKIKSIGKVALLPNEYDNTYEIDTPVFKTIATLEKQNIRAYDKDITFKPGMSFDAEIIVDHRNLIEWVLDPLYRNI